MKAILERVHFALNLVLATTMCTAAVNCFGLLAFLTPGPGEMLLLALVALLLYGGDLPQVARTWGNSFAEFRRSLSGIQRDLNEVIYSEPERRLEYHPPRTPVRDDAVSEPDYSGSSPEQEATSAKAEAE
jgi:Sec-independent protein translocase protein TatA